MAYLAAPISILPLSDSGPKPLCRVPTRTPAQARSRRSEGALALIVPTAVTGLPRAMSPRKSKLSGAESTLIIAGVLAPCRKASSEAAVATKRTVSPSQSAEPLASTGPAPWGGVTVMSIAAAV